MKKIGLIGVVLSMALIIFGIAFPMPEKHLYVSSYAYRSDWTGNGEEYVGGDAYNYQMEASLKAGWVSGVVTMKTICICSGVLILFLTFAETEKLRLISERAGTAGSAAGRTPDTASGGPEVPAEMGMNSTADTVEQSRQV